MKPSEPHFIVDHILYFNLLRDRYPAPDPNESIEAFEEWDRIMSWIETTACRLAAVSRARTRKRIYKLY